MTKGVYDYDTKSVRKEQTGIKKEAPSLFQYFQLSLLYLLTRCSLGLFQSYFRITLFQISASQLSSFFLVTDFRFSITYLRYDTQYTVSKFLSICFYTAFAQSYPPFLWITSYTIEWRKLIIQID